MCWFCPRGRPTCDLRLAQLKWAIKVRRALTHTHTQWPHLCVCVCLQLYTLYRCLDRVHPRPLCVFSVHDCALCLLSVYQGQESTPRLAGCQKKAKMAGGRKLRGDASSFRPLLWQLLKPAGDRFSFSEGRAWNVVVVTAWFFGEHFAPKQHRRHSDLRLPQQGRQRKRCATTMRLSKGKRAINESISYLPPEITASGCHPIKMQGREKIKMQYRCYKTKVDRVCSRAIKASQQERAARVSPTSLALFLPNCKKLNMKSW